MLQLVMCLSLFSKLHSLHNEARLPDFLLLSMQPPGPGKCHKSCRPNGPLKKAVPVTMTITAVYSINSHSIDTAMTIGQPHLELCIIQRVCLRST